MSTSRPSGRLDEGGLCPNDAFFAPSRLLFLRRSTLWNVPMSPSRSFSFLRQDPRIDGNTGDWAMVPDSYAIGMDQLMDTEHGHGMNHDPKNMDVKVKWMGQGPQSPLLPLPSLRQLLGLRAHRPAQRHLRSCGGWRSLRRTLDRYLPPRCLDSDAVGKARSVIDPRISQAEAHWAMHGVHAQNYHIFTRRAIKTGPWPGAARSISSGCLTPTPPTTTLQTGRERQAGAGILYHALRLLSLRRPATRRGIRPHREQADRPLNGP